MCPVRWPLALSSSLLVVYDQGLCEYILLKRETHLSILRHCLYKEEEKRRYSNDTATTPKQPKRESKQDLQCQVILGLPTQHCLDIGPFWPGAAFQRNDSRRVSLFCRQSSLLPVRVILGRGTVCNYSLGASRAYCVLWQLAILTVRPQVSTTSLFPTSVSFFLCSRLRRILYRCLITPVLFLELQWRLLYLGARSQQC